MTGVKPQPRTPEEEYSLRGTGVTMLDAGWSVVPTYPDKKPAGGWSELQKKKLSVPQFQSRLNRSQEETGDLPTGLAVITGRVSNVVVLDFDGEEGLDTLDSLGLKPHVQTGSGGYHVYLRHPGFPVSTLNSKSKASLRREFPGMDIRGDGGYAIFCGRSESGSYRSMREFSDLETIEALPPRLADVLRGIYPAQEEAPQRETKPLPPSSSLPERKLSQAIEKAQNGEGRNNSGFWLAQQLRDNGLPQGEASSLMQRYQESVTGLLDGHGNPSPYPWSEAQATLSSVYRDSPREPEGKGSDFSVNVQTKATSQSSSPAQVNKWSLLEKPSQVALRPPKPWLLEGLVGVGDFIIVAGQPAAGKSFIALDLAVALVLGKAFCGRFSAALGPKKVLYFASEDYHDRASRLAAVAVKHGVTVPDLDERLAIHEGVPNLFLSAGEDSVRSVIEGVKASGFAPDLIVVDTLADALAGANENDASDAAVVNSHIKEMREALGCAVLVVHHTGKTGESERGSSAYRAKADTLVMVSSNEANSGEMYVSKLKAGRAGYGVPFSLAFEEVASSLKVTWQGDHDFVERFTEAEREVLAILGKAGRPLTRSELGQELGLTNSSSISSRVQRLVDLGRVRGYLQDPSKPASRGNPYSYHLPQGPQVDDKTGRIKLDFTGVV